MIIIIIKSQIVLLIKKVNRDFIINHNDLELIDYYIDDGYSGTNFNRPGFKSLFKDLVNSKINTIVVKDLSRLVRNYIDVGNYLENVFFMYETRFISINDEIDNCCKPESIDNIGVPL